MMNCAQERRNQINQNVRQKNRQKIRQKIREKLTHKPYIQELPLLSCTLELFWDLNHFQLCQNSQKLMEVIESTYLEELSDEEHQEFVTDLLYLVQEKVIPEPCYLKFKRNGDIYTGGLVAALSEGLEAEEVAYWVDFMDEESKKLMFAMIEGQGQSHKKWVTNQKLFICMLQQVKYMTQAAEAYRSILINSDDLSKKQIDQSVLYLHKAIISASDQKRQFIRTILLSIWMKTILIYQKLKQSQSKIDFMVTVLANEIQQITETFLNIQIVSDLNSLYEQDLRVYLQEEFICQKIIQFVAYQLDNYPEVIQGDHPAYYLNSLFRLFFNVWKSRRYSHPTFLFSPNFYNTLSRISIWTVDNAWYLKLVNLLKKQALN